MTSSELMTMVRYQLPIKIAIMNDGSLTMVETWEKLFYEERIVATCNRGHNPNYCALAEAYGMKSLECSDIRDLPATVKEFIEYDGPILCNFKVTGEPCYPLVAPGSALDNMILKNPESLNKADLGTMAPN